MILYAKRKWLVSLPSLIETSEVTIRIQEDVLSAMRCTDRHFDLDGAQNLILRKWFLVRPHPILNYALHSRQWRRICIYRGHETPHLYLYQSSQCWSGFYGC